VGFYPLSFDNHIQPIKSHRVFARLQTGCRRANRSAKARTMPLTLFSESALRDVEVDWVTTSELLLQTRDLPIGTKITSVSS
jgi:hypothetical protein